MLKLKIKDNIIILIINYILNDFKSFFLNIKIKIKIVLPSN